MVKPWNDAVEPNAGFDVEALEARTQDLRAMDHRSGGGSCLDDLLTLILQTQCGLTVSAAEIGQRRQDAVLADLYNLTGWACFDIGLTDRAHVHFSQALMLAGRAHDDRLVADIFYRLGRVRLHGGNPAEALDFFHVGQLSAWKPGCELAASVLSMNQAWAYAAMGVEDRAIALLNRSAAQFAGADDSAGPGWSKFFTRTDMGAMVGAVHAELAHRVDPRHAQIAIPALTEATDGYGDEMARSRAFSLILLAMSHLIGGDVDRGVDVGFRALASAENLASVRVRDRMRRLQQDAELHDSHRGAQELVARIVAFTSPIGDMS